MRNTTPLHQRFGLTWWFQDGKLGLLPPPEAPGGSTRGKSPASLACIGMSTCLFSAHGGREQFLLDFADGTLSHNCENFGRQTPEY